MQWSKRTYWAIGLTLGVHVLMLIIFAFKRVQFQPKAKWSYVNMSLQDFDPTPPPQAKEKIKIPKNYEEKGLENKKYSVAKTNQAVNQATNELSKAQKAQIDREMEQAVQDMARKHSSTDLGKAGPKAGKSGAEPEASKSKATINKEGSDAGTSDLGNAHNQTTNISYYLKDRTEGIIGLYNPVYVCQGGGKVVVDIIVNPLGEVISAKVNTQQSEVKDPCLWKAAKSSALKSTFNSNDQAIARQQGTITYIFMAQ